MSVCNIYDASGKLVWSLGDYGSVMCDVVFIPANTPMTLTYPAFAGRTVWAEEIWTGARGTGASAVVTYPSGVPTVTFASNSQSRTSYIWTE